MKEVIDTILDELRACKSDYDVSMVSRKYSEAMKKIDASPEYRVRGIHIRNLAALKRKGFRS